MHAISTKEKYLDPYTDFGFKKLFGTESNKELPIDFLNQLITEQGTIVDLRYLPAEQLGRNPYDKRAIFDIYCENENGEKFIVEMQKVKQDYFRDKSVFYASFPIYNQALLGEWDFNFKAVYFVGILDFVFASDKDDENVFYHDVKLVDLKTKKVFYDKLSFIYLEMPKFNKTEEQLETQLDKWLYALKSLPKFQSRPAKLQERVFSRLFKVAELAQFTPEEAISYEDSLKAYRDNINTFNFAIREATEKGKAAGIAEGIAEGEAKGKIEIILHAHSKGFSLAQIADFSGVAIDFVEKVLQDNKEAAV